MKLLMIAHSSDIHGGANRSLISLIENLNHEITVLVPKNEGELVNYLCKNNINHIVFNYNIITTKKVKGIKGILRYIKLIYKFFYDYIRSFNLKKIIEKYNFDLIYTNSRTIYIGGFVSRLLNVPHIWHMRELLVENSLRTVPFEYKIIDNLSSQIIVISKFMQNIFNKNIDNSKIKLVYNGLEDIDTQVNLKNEICDISKILIVGTIIAAKGQLEAIKAIGLLKKNGYKVQLNIVGSDPEINASDSYKRMLDIEINKMGLNKDVIFHGEMENLDKIRGNTHIELICSKCEAFGRVVVEAMKSGNIVIGSDSGAIPEIIKENYNGILYKNGDDRDLAEKIKKVIDNKNFAQSLSVNAIEFSKNNFTIQNTVKEISLIIKNVRISYK